MTSHAGAPSRAFAAQAILIAGGLILSLLICFHGQIVTGFRVLFGDERDGMIAVSISAHWYRVLLGDSWNVTGYFYPYPDTLGYNDGYLLYGLIAAALRPLGADPFLGQEIAATFVKAAGYISTVALARKAFRIPIWASVLAAIIFTIANNSIVGANHGQLLTVALAPLGFLFVFSAIDSLIAGRRKALFAYGTGFILLYGVWLLTSYYMAWFFAYFTIVLFLAIGILTNRQTWQVLLLRMKESAVLLIALAALTALTITPFLVVYLPIARQTGGEGVVAALPYLAHLSDAIAVGKGNLIWGGVLARVMDFWPSLSPQNEEHIAGFPLLLLIFAGLGIFRLFKKPNLQPSQPVTIMRAVAFATLLTWATIFVFYHVTLWELVHALMPGAEGVRTVIRYQIFLALPITLLAVQYLAHLSARKISSFIIVMAAVFLIVEEIDTAPPIALDRKKEMAMLRAVSAPMRFCTVFYVFRSQIDPAEDAFIPALYDHNVQAMMMSSWLGLPTINGFATFNPPDWNFAGPDRPDYLSRIRIYAAAHRLQGICGFDLSKRSWVKGLASS